MIALTSEYIAFQQFLRGHVLGKTVKSHEDNAYSFLSFDTTITESDSFFNVVCDSKDCSLEGEKCIALKVVIDKQSPLVDAELLGRLGFLMWEDMAGIAKRSNLPTFLVRASSILIELAGCDFMVFGVHCNDEAWHWLDRYLEDHATSEAFDVLPRGAGTPFRY